MRKMFMSILSVFVVISALMIFAGLRDVPVSVDRINQALHESLPLSRSEGPVTVEIATLDVRLPGEGQVVAIFGGEFRIGQTAEPIAGELHFATRWHDGALKVRDFTVANINVAGVEASATQSGSLTRLLRRQAGLNATETTALDLREYGAQGAIGAFLIKDLRAVPDRFEMTVDFRMMGIMTLPFSLIPLLILMIIAARRTIARRAVQTGTTVQCG